ncbi:MAG: hypothetical protein KatS3mg110_4461 [Pirellulaceae bacterium]|nr:MAG: hypothetical protein KatS3mg110_4461 [Pirellulaceae bacterium]
MMPSIELVRPIRLYRSMHRPFEGAAPAALGGCLALWAIFLCLPGCVTRTNEASEPEEPPRVVVTTPRISSVDITLRYVCQIHSRRNIEIRAMEGGYIEKVLVNEGQAVKKGDLMFTILPTLYKARYDAELAEARLAELELKNTERLYQNNVVSQNEVALYEAKLARAKARAALAEAELNFTEIRAPFDGIVDRLLEREGSLVEEGTVLTTLSDNAVMWVYFNVPEAGYLQYMAGLADKQDGWRIELVLADGTKFPHEGKIAAIEAQFNNETGTIPFRADFPNPEGLLRHGQTGNILISRTLPNALLIPQRATFNILDKHFVFVVDKEGHVRQREITIEHELEDIYVVRSGLQAEEQIVLEGIGQVTDGQKVEYEFRAPDEVFRHLKYHAE